MPHKTSYELRHLISTFLVYPYIECKVIWADDKDHLGDLLAEATDWYGALHGSFWVTPEGFYKMRVCRGPGDWIDWGTRADPVEPDSFPGNSNGQ